MEHFRPNKSEHSTNSDLSNVTFFLQSDFWFEDTAFNQEKRNSLKPVMMYTTWYLSLTWQE